MRGPLVATEKFPLVKLRSVPHQVHDDPIVDFIHVSYLHIMKVFIIIIIIIITIIITNIIVMI